MNRVKLTKKVIESAKPGKAEFVLWDRQLIGFGCKITPKDGKRTIPFYFSKLHRSRLTVAFSGMHGVSRSSATYVLPRNRAISTS